MALKIHKDVHLMAALFFLSFAIMAFQVYLTLVFSFICPKSGSILFLPLSEAFLGTGMAGFYLTFRGHRFKNADRDFLSLSLAMIVSFSAFFYFLPVVSGGLDRFLLGQMSSSVSGMEAGYFRAIVLSFMALGVLGALPFFVFGLILFSCFRFYQEKFALLYFSDLLGASLGCFAAVMVLPFLGMANFSLMLLFCASLFILFFFLHRGLKNTKALFLMSIFAVVLLWSFNEGLGIFELKPDPRLATRDYSGKLRSEEVWSGWNIYGRVGLFRQEQKTGAKEMVFSIGKGEGMARVLPFVPEDPFRYSLNDDHFSAVQIAFRLGAPREILIMLSGAGKDLVEAYSYSRGRSRITAVELNPLIADKALALPEAHLDELMKKSPGIRWVVYEGRSYLGRDTTVYDAIIFFQTGSSYDHFLGATGYPTQYLFTKEAFQEYYKHLSPSGVLICSSRKNIIVLATLKKAFQEHGGRGLHKKVVVFVPEDSLKGDLSETYVKHALVLVKNSDLTADEIRSLEGYAESRGYILAYSPVFCYPQFSLYGDILKSEDVEGLMRTLGRSSGQDFRISVDDRPVGRFHFLAWLKMAEIPVAAADFFETLFSVFYTAVLLLTVIFLGWPLLFRFRGCLAYSASVGSYFALIGFAYILVEIFFMRYLELFFGGAFFSLAIVLTIFLLFSGLGGWFSARAARFRHFTFFRFHTVVLLVLGGCYALSGSLKDPFFFHLDLWSKVFLVVPVLGTIGFLLGIYFPTGFRAISHRCSESIPYALGVDSAAAVAGSLTGIFVAYYAGTRAILLLAIISYMMLFFLYSGLSSASAYTARGAMSAR